MALKWLELFRWKFDGPRYKQHGLDLRDMRMLIASREIIVGLAARLWREIHPDDALPRGWSRADIQIFQLGPGSTDIVSKCRFVSRQEPLFSEMDYRRADFTELLRPATRMFVGLVGDTAKERPPPFGVSVKDQRHLAVIGASLGARNFAILESLCKIDGPWPRGLDPEYGSSPVTVTQSSFRPLRRSVRGRAAKSTSVPETKTPITFTGTVTGSAEPDRTVALEIVGKASFNASTNSIEGAVITEVKKVDSESLTSANEVVIAKPMAKGIVEAADYVERQLGRRFRQAATIIAETLANAPNAPHDVDEILAPLKPVGFKWDDAYMVLGKFVGAEVPFAEEVFYMADDGSSVDADEFEDRLRAAEFGTDADKAEWEAWASGVIVAWRWTRAAS